MADRTYHHGDLRSALLNGAREVLRERSVDELSLRELARRIGVSHAAPSRHFKDKQALLDALALDGFDHLAKLLESAKGRTFRAQLIACARAYTEFAVTEPRLLELMFARKHAPEVSTQLLAAVERTTNAVVVPIEKAQAGREVVPGDPWRIAMVLGSTFYGFAAMAADSAPSTVDLTSMVDYLLNGLAPR